MITVETGAILPRSPWDVIAIVGLAAKGDNTPTLINSLDDAIVKYGERLSLSTASNKGIKGYGLVDAIETIYSYLQVPIIAINSATGATSEAIAPITYTFNLDKIQLQHPNVLIPVITNVAGDTTYTTPADYTVNNLTGMVSRSPASTIPALGSVKVGYSVVNFSGSIDWIDAIDRVAGIGNYKPTLITLAGVEITAEIAIALNTKAIALGAIAVFSHPGLTATAAVPLLSSISSVGVFPIRNSERGLEESGVHFCATIALGDYWENPEGSPLKESAIALNTTDSALLILKGITQGGDRVISAIATNGLPFNIARLRVRVQAIASVVSAKWRLKPLDLTHLEGIGQAIRDALNREAIESSLPYAVVNYNAAQSVLSDRKLVYDITLKGGNQGDRISEIIIFVG